MHRNTWIFVSILAVIAALLVGIRIGMNVQSTPSDAPEAPAQTPLPTVTPIIVYKTYTDSACDLSVSYPSSLQIMESTTSGTILADTNDPNGSVVIVCQAEIPRVPLTPDRIETLTLTTANGASVSARLYHDGSGMDGTPIDKLIFTHPTNGLDVFIAGYGDVYQQIVASIKLL